MLNAPIKENLRMARTSTNGNGTRVSHALPLAPIRVIRGFPF